MDTKHYTEVLIDGRIYTLGGTEDEGYKQSAEYQTAMIELNMADDYFKAREQIARLEQLKHEMEKEVYSLKHELVTTQMKLEAANKELAAGRTARPSGASGNASESKKGADRTGSENKE